MKSGWAVYLDDPKQSLLMKVDTAVLYYKARNRSQPTPNRCHVHPSALDGDAQLVKTSGVIVVADPLVLPNHFLVGTADD